METIQLTKDGYIRKMNIDDIKMSLGYYQRCSDGCNNDGCCVSWEKTFLTGNNDNKFCSRCGKEYRYDVVKPKYIPIKFGGHLKDDLSYYITLDELKKFILNTVNEAVNETKVVNILNGDLK